MGLKSTMKERISQIFLDDAGCEIPQLIQEQSSRLRTIFAGYDHAVYRNDQLEEFIQKYFDNDVLSSYKSLAPYAFKADLGRYCLLYQLGGWYVDITIKPIKFFSLPSEMDFFYFYDLGHNIIIPQCQMSDCQNGLFYSEPRHSILENAINMVVSNCKAKHKGITPLSLTGPGLFGKAIANAVPSRSIMHGHFMPLTPYHRRKNMAYVAPSGDLMAWHKTAWLSEERANMKGLEGFGVNTGNSYLTLWEDDRVFTQ